MEVYVKDECPLDFQVAHVRNCAVKCSAAYIAACSTVEDNNVKVASIITPARRDPPRFRNKL